MGIIESILLAYLGVFLLGVTYAVFFIWALMHCLKYCPHPDKTTWVIVIIWVPFGFIFYKTMAPSIYDWMKGTPPPPPTPQPKPDRPKPTPPPKFRSMGDGSFPPIDDLINK